MLVWMISGSRLNEWPIIEKADDGYSQETVESHNRFLEEFGKLRENLGFEKSEFNLLLDLGLEIMNNELLTKVHVMKSAIAMTNILGLEPELLKEISNQYGLEKEDAILAVVLGAIFHDIGKVIKPIRKRIINQMTQEELEKYRPIINQHPTIGSIIFESLVSINQIEDSYQKQTALNGVVKSSGINIDTKNREVIEINEIIEKVKAKFEKEVKKVSSFEKKVQSEVDENILRLVSDYILYHHENYKGGGYPSDLEGIRIPLIARLAAIIDITEAMTGKHFKKNLSDDDNMDKNPIEKTLSTMKKVGRYDPDLIVVLERVINKTGLKIFEVVDAK